MIMTSTALHTISALALCQVSDKQEAPSVHPVMPRSVGLQKGMQNELKVARKYKVRLAHSAYVKIIRTHVSWGGRRALL